MSNFKSNLHGIIAMCASMAGLILNDACVKKVSDAGLPTGEIIFIRGLAAVALITVIALRFGLISDIRRLFTRAVSYRTFGEVAGTLMYLLALFNMPIANATAILQALPLLITAGAAVFLGEKVGWHRWTAVVIGFIGVMIIVRPGLEGFDAYALLVVGAMLLIAMRDLVTRNLPGGLSTHSVTWYTTIWVCLLGAGMAPTEDWIMPSVGQFALLIVASGFVLIGYFGAIAAVRVGDMSVIAPFRYTIVVWAILLGYFLWGDVPDAYTLAGTGLIVAMGVYTVIRERRVSEETG